MASVLDVASCALFLQTVSKNIEIQKKKLSAWSAPACVLLPQHTRPMSLRAWSRFRSTQYVPYLLPTSVISGACCLPFRRGCSRCSCFCGFHKLLNICRGRMLNVLFLFTAGYFCLLGDVKGYEGELQIRFHINSQLSETSSETSSKSGINVTGTVACCNNCTKTTPTIANCSCCCCSSFLKLIQINSCTIGQARSYPNSTKTVMLTSWRSPKELFFWSRIMYNESIIKQKW